VANGDAPIAVTVQGPDVVAISGQALAIGVAKGGPIQRPVGVGIAVQGTSDAGQGVVAKSTSGVALTASSQSGTAIIGTSETAEGIRGESTTADGVHGIGKNGIHGDSASPTDSGVWGNNSGGGNGVSGSTTAAGAGYGVYGVSAASDGVHGVCNSEASGVAGISNNGTGVYGRGGKNAGYFDGNVQVNGKVTITDTLTAITDVVLGADCAEEFDAAAPDAAEPGTVMVLDQQGSLRPSDQAYDKRVAGVISGAGGFKPGLILDKRESSEGRVLIALVGKVFCKVDARYASIEVGDMLTTSPTVGYAMKAVDSGQAFGSVIGKALAAYAGGLGMVPILVGLQ
jgi:hypothetical protein